MYGRVPDEVHQDPHARSHWSVAHWLATAARGALVLNPTPFAQRSTPQQADHQTESTLATALPGSGDPRSSK